MTERAQGPTRIRTAAAATILTTLAALAWVPPLIAQAESPGPVQEPWPSWIERLDSVVPDLMERAELPGVSIAVLDEGEVRWTGAFGTTDASGGTAVTEETVFEAASLSKPVFAYAVLRLARRGVLDLDAPLTGIIDDPRVDADPRHVRITPRHVLSHSTGLPNWGGERLDLAFDPGEGFRYSGEGFVYLQKAVSALTGLSLDELARREVFEPLAMRHSSYLLLDGEAPTVAQPHDGLGLPGPKRTVGGTGNAASSLHTTASDYARFVSALLRGEGLGVEWRDVMLTPQVELTENVPADGRGRLHWGLGWGLYEGPDGLSFWHWGDNGNFKAYVTAYPEGGRGLVYFSNSFDGLSLVEGMVREVLGRDQGPVADWLGYERYDDPTRTARKSLQRAFLSEGLEAGVAAYRELLRTRPKALDEAAIRRLGSDLLAGGRRAEAIRLLELNVDTHPSSVVAHRALGRAHLEEGQLEAGLKSFTLAAELEPDDADVQRGLAWIRDMLEARQRPVHLPVPTLATFAGRYGPRLVALEEGRLVYQREDGPRYRLVPLTRETFLLDGLNTFRLRFVTGPDGAPTSVEGLYFDGSRDTSPRDPGG